MSRRQENGEQFIMHMRRMRESAAWAALDIHDLRVLFLLEMRHMEEGGVANGKLACSFSDFARGGVRRQSVARAIRRLVALGFIEITQRGFKAAAGFNKPSTYRLTYMRPAKGNRDGMMPTNEWSHFENAADAKSALEKAGVPSIVKVTPPPRGKTPYPGDIEESADTAPSKRPPISADTAPSKRAA